MKFIRNNFSSQKLFGYMEKRTMLLIFKASLFTKGPRKPISDAQKHIRERYGGTTFVVLGRTHDQSIERLVAEPKTVSKTLFIGQSPSLVIQRNNLSIGPSST